MKESVFQAGENQTQTFIFGFFIFNL